MPERASKSQVTQLGWEVTYGAGATVTKKLMSLTLEPHKMGARTRNFAQGYNFPSSSTKGKDWSEWGLSGALVFDELHIPLSMALGSVTPVAQTPATAMKWTWTVPLSGDITPKSAKLEKGDVNTAESAVGAVMRELGFTWDRDGFEISGTVLAQKLLHTAALTTSGITTFPQVALDPAGIGVWIDTTSAGLGTTRMLRVFEGGISIGNLYNGIWPLNELKTSFDGIISLQPETESTLQLMADATGKALLTNLDAGDRRWLRWKVVGPQIGAGPAVYTLQIDMAIEVISVDEQTDDDGLYVIPLTFAPMADETWTKALEISLINTQTTY